MVNDSAAAAEVTIQPIRRFGFDGAILFSDILMVPSALGQDLSFGVGEGPALKPALVDHALQSLQAAPERLEPVYETVRQVAASLPSQTTFLGFAGSPWTVATYMVAGHGSRDQGETRRFAYTDPAAFQEIISAIVTVTVDYLSKQIESGVVAVQLFDSWAAASAPHSSNAGSSAPMPLLSGRCTNAIQAYPLSVSQRVPAQSLPLMFGKPGSTRSGSTKRSIRHGLPPRYPRICPFRETSIRWY